jgi:hypothetical protein
MSGRPAAPENTIKVRYLEVSPILARGAVTGRDYYFSAMRPLQPVDGRDAQALLQTGFFRRA